MASNQYTIFVVMFLTTFRLSTGNNADYSVCSTTRFSCGRVKNIGYPFWGGNRPQFCGHPNFLLTCKIGPDTTFMHHLGNTTSPEYPGSFSASVVNISTSHSTISLVENPFSNPPYVSCRKLITNETAIRLLKPFKFSRTVTNISLFFDCNTTVSHNSSFESFRCRHENNNITDSAYYSDDKLADDVGAKSCHTRRVFPVLKSELGKLSKGNGILGVLNKGFEVKYVVSEYDYCIKCQNSGGSCGSSKNSQTTFSCYCQNGIHPLVCPKSGKKLQNYLGPGIGGGVLILVAVFLILCRKHLKFGKAKSASDDRSDSELRMESLDLGVPLFSYKQLQEATEGFDETRELGNGGYGAVYYGKLKDGREVAVKRLYEKNFKRVDQFMNEVRILTCVRHQNLVSLYGCTSCHSRDLLLVYEYVSNGTVADHLYGHKANSGTFLSWSMRLKIAIETASALSYLHATDIIHRDVKTNNILLGKDFNVKVADFGLSRLFPNDVTHVSTAPQGTLGYLDPAYHQCYQLTDKSDVYSFGVVLIELISSLRAVDMNRHNYEVNLANYAMNRIRKCAFSGLVDPQLGFKSDLKVKRMTIAVAELAFRCLQHYKDFRPSMDEVLEVLQRIQSFDYEALQTEEMLKNEPVQINNFAPSPTDDGGVKLLSNRELFGHSPTSVMEIVSGSTISESTGS